MCDRRSGGLPETVGARGCHCVFTRKRKQRRRRHGVSFIAAAAFRGMAGAARHLKMGDLMETSRDSTVGASPATTPAAPESVFHLFTQFPPRCQCVWMGARLRSNQLLHPLRCPAFNGQLEAPPTAAGHCRQSARPDDVPPPRPGCTSG
jgi:hypothetical protein